jgi:sugar phosphate isomerase/epimerase
MWEVWLHRSGVARLWVLKKNEKLLLIRCASRASLETIGELGVRSYGVVRIDSASSPEKWAADPVGNTKLIAQTFREACDVAADFGEKLAAEGEICWGGMHSWKAMLNTMELVDRPNMGFQADMAHTLLYTMGYNSPEDRILPKDFDWKDKNVLNEA